MTDDPHIRLGRAEEGGRLPGRLFVVEGHHDDRPVTLASFVLPWTRPVPRDETAPSAGLAGADGGDAPDA